MLFKEGKNELTPPLRIAHSELRIEFCLATLSQERASTPFKAGKNELPYGMNCYA